jgi:formylglycine-generating enzyme required for sulfatase activity
MTDAAQGLVGGRYRIDRFADIGNFRAASALDETTGKQVHLKSIAPGMGDSGERLLHDLERQAQLYPKLDHPGIAILEHFYPPGELGPEPYLVTASLDGDLERLLGSQELSQDRRLDLCRQLLLALNHLHGQGLLHLQLSDACVEVSADLSRLCLWDLGAAGSDAEAIPIAPDYRFSAPELFDPSRQVTAAADVYSAGLLCLRLLLGEEGYRKAFREIYREDERIPRAERFLNWQLDDSRELPDYDSLSPACSRDIYGVLQQMCAKDTGARFRDVSEAMAALSRASGGSAWEQQTLRPLDAEPLRDSSQRRQYLILAGGIAAILLVCTAAYLYLQPEPVNVTPSLEAAKRARDEAIRLGAEPQSVREFALGMAEYELAREAYREERDQQSIAFLQTARGYFEAAIESAREGLLRRLSSAEEDALTRAWRLRPVDIDELRVGVSAGFDLIREALEAEDYGALLARQAEAEAALEERLAVTDRLFVAGSTAQEIAGALAVCRESGQQCEASWYASEREREVRLAPFRLDPAEVTVADFTGFVAATGYITAAEVLGQGHVFDGELSLPVAGLNWRQPLAVGANAPSENPVTQMGVTDAAAYCEWRGGRLPREEEWEYASRGPERFVYTWGDAFTRDYLELGRNQPHAAGRFDQRAWFRDLRDLTGNVWEWVRTADGGSGLKGGSYLETHAANLRSAARRDPVDGVVNADDGFRCAYDSERWPSQRPLR